MRCATCSGKGLIHRPVRKVEARVFEKPYNYKERYTAIMKAETVYRKIGGIDACPICTKESEYDFYGSEVGK